MAINKVKENSNMYQFINATWNPIKGHCPHTCSYCYYQNNPRFKSKIGKLRLDEKCLKDNLSQDDIIFVGSSCDMFAKSISSDWIKRILKHCDEYPENTYLFQSKNPMRFIEFCFPKNSILGATIESNNVYNISQAPSVVNRYIAMKHFKDRKMISIEPILDFDLEILVRWIQEINPEFVSIGADSKGHNLPEPSSSDINSLIKELKLFTEIRVKNNLKRLLI